MPQHSNGRRQIVVVEAPAHPVSQLQGPFEESMFESQSTATDENDVPLDASTRRNMLLEAPTYQRVIAGRWKQKPGEKFHPLWKLIAQMSFGIHLLSEGMAKSEEDVFQILQNHVDDIDIFLERTTEDFTLAQDDIQERLKCLKLPLQHPEVFERMLEDRTFRNSIVEGNEKIEHIVNRTGSAMKDALKDVQKGFDSTSCLEKYLKGLETSWSRQSQEHEAVFVAMVGNVEGWKKAFLDLHMQGNKLAGSLRKLTEVVNQMQQRAGEVSRRLVRQQHRQGGSIVNSNSFTYHSRQQSPQRTSSRQQHAQSSRVPDRQHSRTTSRETPRVDSGQAQRSGTGQSMRSGDGRAETPTSRSASRNDAPAGPQDPARMNIGSPRVVYVKSHTGHHRANSLSASVRGPHGSGTESRNDSALSNRSGTPQHQLRKQESVISALDQPTPTIVEPKQFAPVELPAEIPPEAFLQAPLSNRNRLSGLGFLPSERRAQAATSSHAFNPATALVELLRDPSRYSKLPLTPTSATTPTVPFQALSALEGKKHLTADVHAANKVPTPQQTPQVGDDNNSDSTPATPAWASQVVNDAEQQQILAEKIPSSSHDTKLSTNGDSLTTPKVRATMPPQPKLDTSIEGSTGSAAASEAPSASAPSELSAGYEESIGRLTRQQAEAAMMIDSPQLANGNRKKLSFIAELQGSDPVFLPSTVYTPISAVTKASETRELQGSESYFTLPIQSNSEDPVSAVISELSSDRSSRLVKLDEKALKTASSDQLQSVLEEVIRKSVSDAEATVPEPPVVPEATKSPIISELPTQMTPKPKHTSQVVTPRAENLSEVINLSSPVPNGTAIINEKSPLVPEVKGSEVKSASPSTLTKPTDVSALPSVVPLVQSTDAETTKSRPVTTIHSPADVEASKLQLPISPGFVTASSSPDVAAVVGKVDTARPTLSQRSVSETKVKLGNKRLSVFPPLRSPSANIVDNAAPISPASAPDVVTRPSPKSSLSANSPASLMSVHSAPAADLTRSNTKDTRKQWKAFFSGQLKSPKSPATSTNSIKSPSASLASSHKHTNSQASQTNASVKTLWLSSPVLAQSPTIEDSTSIEPPKITTKRRSSRLSQDKRPTIADVHQASSPTLGISQTGIGLGLITSPTIQSPSSAIESPVVATATTSTAYARQAPRSVPAGTSHATPPATTSTFISYPKPRMIEVRRKAVGSGIASNAGSRPSSAAGNDRKEDATDDKTKLSVAPGSRSASPLQVTIATPTPQKDDDATPKIGSVADNKPKLKVEIATPKQIQVVHIGKASPALERAKVSDSPAVSPKTQLEVSNNGQNGTKEQQQQQQQQEQEPAKSTTANTVAEDTASMSKGDDNNDNSNSSHQRQDSDLEAKQFTKGHERDSSDDNYDFLDAYA